MNEIRPLKEEDKELFCSFPPCQNKEEELPGREPAPDSARLGTLILEFLASRTVGKCISIVDKPLPPQVMGIFVTAAKAKTDGKGPA